MQVPQLESRDQQAIERFQAKYPQCYVRVVPIFAGFASFHRGDLPFSHHAIWVYNAETGRTTSFHHGSIQKTLQLAELDISGTRSDGSRHHYDRNLVTSFLPDDLQQSGWRCSGTWWTQRSGDGLPYHHISLVGPNHSRIEYEDWDFMEVLDLLIEDAIAANSKQQA